MRINLFALIGMLLCSVGFSNVHTYNKQNEKDYFSLLSKSYFYKDTKARNLKYLAAKMIYAVSSRVLNAGMLTLSKTRQTGLHNIMSFASKIMTTLGKEPTIVASAYKYAIEAALYYVPNEQPGFYARGECFQAFNDFYSPHHSRNQIYVQKTNFFAKGNKLERY